MPLTTDERRSVAGLENRDQNAAVAVLANDVGLWDAAVADRGDVVQIDRRPVHLLDGRLLIPASVTGED